MAPGELHSELLVESGADLAAALPESLIPDEPVIAPPTVTIDLPATVHTVPDHETALAIEHSAIDPRELLSVETVGTTSIKVATGEHLIIPAAPDVPAPAPIPPLPSVDTVTTRKTRQAARDHRPVPIAPGEPEPIVARPVTEKPTGKRARRPRPEGRWPAIVYGATLTAVNIGDSRRVRERKQLEARIARHFDGGPRFIPVLTRKGGVGKTTVTTIMGMAMADVRRDRVLAIDANPDRGTLAERVSKQNRFTVRDAVLRAPDITDFDAFSALVSRDETRLDVLASDTDPMLSEAFNENDYNVVADLASKYYSVILTDCGTGIVHSVMRATLQRADAVVIVSGGSVDEARLASETLTWLEANGYGALARNAIVALNTATHGTNLVKLEEIEAHFRSRVRDIVRIPYDVQLAAGSVVDFKSLRPLTRNSARELAALVADGLPANRVG
ncbi:MinD/ParA family protein [Glaciihabitans arcticus]|uniref:MinD/ParA family protein n=1 Tax=Glaciihabitans arcticus TaxID=2668039 RepID=A0A4Q9H1B3_9MICO|nr:MinD/ParA family protein [Glaciihabitans arcticus]